MKSWAHFISGYAQKDLKPNSRLIVNGIQKSILEKVNKKRRRKGKGNKPFTLKKKSSKWKRKLAKNTVSRDLQSLICKRIKGKKGLEKDIIVIDWLYLHT